MNGTGKLFIIACLFIGLFFFVLSDSHIMQKTKSGNAFENFTTLDSRFLPVILSEYFKHNYVRFSLYKLPNYVIDLLKDNKDFFPVYNSGNNYTVIVFKDETLGENNTSFYKNLNAQIKMYPENFNFLSFDSNKKVNYNFKYYNFAYKDLKEYCQSFCLINPSNNTMFVFNKITDAESKALDVLFQQYYFMLK